MSEDLRFVPPRVAFDPRLANELARFELATATVADEAYPLAGRPNPFSGYVRMLTPEGGILILYQDQDRSLFPMSLRVFTWVMASGMGGWLLLFAVGSVSILNVFVVFPLLMLINWLIVRRKIIVSHSVEIRPECMILDGEDVFYAEDIGNNWPNLGWKDGDPDRLVIAGICGTRYIEFMTANRLDKNDRTAEVLAADLEAAMEQLWGRREVA
jgi:hypothetical protein